MYTTLQGSSRAPRVAEREISRLYRMPHIRAMRARLMTSSEPRAFLLCADASLLIARACVARWNRAVNSCSVFRATSWAVIIFIFSSSCSGPANRGLVTHGQHEEARQNPTGPQRSGGVFTACRRIRPANAKTWSFKGRRREPDLRKKEGKGLHPEGRESANSRPFSVWTQDCRPCINDECRRRKIRRRVYEFSSRACIARQNCAPC